MSFLVGDIVHVSGLPIYPPHGKFAVLVLVAPNWLLLVNSENRESYDCIPLPKKGRPFPRHDSFIGCRNIFTASDSQIDSKCGQLTKDELQALSEKIEASRYHSKITKQRVMAAIQAQLDSLPTL